MARSLLGNLLQTLQLYCYFYWKHLSHSSRWSRAVCMIAIDFRAFAHVWKSGWIFFLMFLSRSSWQQIRTIFSLPSNLFIAYFFSWPKTSGNLLNGNSNKKEDKKGKKGRGTEKEKKKEEFRLFSRHWSQHFIEMNELGLLNLVMKVLLCFPF